MIVDVEGNTPLHIGPISHGVDLTPGLFAAMAARNRAGMTPLMAAALRATGNTGICCPGCRSEASTSTRATLLEGLPCILRPLSPDANKGNTGLTKALLEAGADPHARDEAGATPLVLAMKPRATVYLRRCSVMAMIRICLYLRG